MISLLATGRFAIGILCLWHKEASMRALVVGIIDRIRNRPPDPRHPPVPTMEVIKPLYVFVREVVQ